MDIFRVSLDDETLSEKMPSSHEVTLKIRNLNL